MGGQRETSYFTSKEFESQEVSMFPKTTQLCRVQAVWVRERLLQERGLGRVSTPEIPSPGSQGKMAVSSRPTRATQTLSQKQTKLQTQNNNNNKRPREGKLPTGLEPLTVPAGVILFSANTLEPPTGNFLEEDSEGFPSQPSFVLGGFHNLLKPVQPLQFSGTLFQDPFLSQWTFCDKI